MRSSAFSSSGSSSTSSTTPRAFSGRTTPSRVASSDLMRRSSAKRKAALRRRAPEPAKNASKRPIARCLERAPRVECARLPPAGEAALRDSHVLVIDDEELYRRALERILARVGHRVSCARDASEAMAIVSAEPLDLVLCDVRMPGIQGLELVRQIHELQPDLPCIVITGYGSADASLQAVRQGDVLG